MNVRTTNIILLTKGHHPYNVKTRKEALIKYMAETCGASELDYSDMRLLKVIKEVILDYLKTASSSEELVRDYFNARLMYGYSELESWLCALAETQVLEITDKGDKYINGFDKESMAYIKNESTGKRMYRSVL